jgi:hypothetical protein
MTLKKLLGAAALLIAFALPGVAQEHRLSPEDQSKFDSYYSRWMEYRQTNNHDQERSMEERMRDVMARNGIPAEVPFDRIASNGGGGYRDHDRDGDRDHDRWHSRLPADQQRDFDSYYSRWQEYSQTNNRDQMRSMEERMRDLKARNNIPEDVPNDVVASGGRR